MNLSGREIQNYFTLRIRINKNKYKHGILMETTPFEFLLLNENS